MQNIEAGHPKLAEEFGETDFNPEKNEKHEELCRVARNIIDCFGWQPNKEGFLIITDTKVIQENPLMIKALEYELRTQAKSARSQKKGAGYFKIITTETSPKSATPLGTTIGEAMRDQPVLILTSMSRSHSKETGIAARGDIRFSEKELQTLIQRLSEHPEATKIDEEKLTSWSERIPEKVWESLKNLAKQRRSRIISITKGHNPYEILTKGAVFETIENLKERGDKIDSLMKEVEKVHITTPLGTDLWLQIHPKNRSEKYTEIEDGRVDKPGKLSNYPIGEWSCSPDWEGSFGILVVDGPCGGNINQDALDKDRPLKLTIQDGQVIKAEGGEEVLKRWKAYLDSGNNKNNDAYRLAELGIGTNARALHDKPHEYWGSSEGEKKYGTCHVAVGSNGSFGRTPNEPNFNAAQIHCDMVLGLNPGGEVTIECYKKDGTSFKLIENGRPIGY